MNKKFWIAGCVIGILAVVASVVMAFCMASSTSIIGGSGWPTWTFHFGKVSWLACVGICLSAVSLVFLLIRKK